MSTSYVVVTFLTAALIGFSAAVNLYPARFVAAALTSYGVPRSWWPWLGAAKAAGAVGLLVGLAVPVVGIVAAACLLVFFAGAVVTVARARHYTHVMAPVAYLAPVLVTLSLGLVA